MFCFDDNVGTVWENAPATLTHQDEYVSVITTANESETIYSPVDDSSVATIARTPYGMVIAIGYDWTSSYNSIDWSTILWYAMHDPYYKTSIELEDIYNMDPFYFNDNYLIYSSFFETNDYFNLNFDYYPENCFPTTDNSQLPSDLNVSDFESLCTMLVNRMGLSSYNVGCNVSSDSSISVSSLSSNCATNYSALFSISLDSKSEPTIWVNPQIFDWNPNSDWDEDECLLGQSGTITLMSYICETESEPTPNASASIQILWEDDYFDWQSVTNIQNSIKRIGYGDEYAFVRVSQLENNISSYSQGTSIIIPSIKKSFMYDYLTNGTIKTKIESFISDGGNFIAVGDGFGLPAKLLQSIFGVSWSYESNYDIDGECDNIG